MLIIIPDLHGDFIQFCNILIYFKIVSTSNINVILNYLNRSDFESYFNFNNKKIIQLGDILDSKNRTKSYDNIKYTDMILFIYLIKLKKIFPENIFLILGNHEYMNCYEIYSYVSTYSSRSKKELNFIRKSIIQYFSLYYIDNHSNLYIHASIPKNTRTLDKLEEYQKLIFEDIINLSNENINKNYNNFILLYDKIFTRNIPTNEILNTLKINRIFLGHTSHDDILVLNNRIFYLDNFISKSFNSLKKNFTIISLTDKDKIISNNILRIDDDDNFLVK